MLKRYGPLADSRSAVRGESRVWPAGPAMLPDAPRPKEALHVLLVSASSGSQGGGELYLVGLAEELHRHGHHVEVVLSDHLRMDALAGLLDPHAKVRRVPYVNTYDRSLRVAASVLDHSAIARLAETFRRLAPNVLHINKQNLEDGLDLVLAAQRSGLSYVTTIHITRSMTKLGAVGGRMRDWIARRVLRESSGHYLVIAESSRAELVRFLGRHASPVSIHTVRNGVAPAPSGDRAAVRTEWNCTPAGLVLGCVARIEEQKNPLFLVELLAVLPEHVKLVWVGDGRMRGELELAAAKAGLSHRLHIDGWRSDARARMAGFDLFVLPSRYEGLPFAVLEAMAAGLPCLVTDADGLREAVLDGECGRVLPPHDVRAWLAALRPAIDDASLRARWGQAARRRYGEHFSLEATGRATLDVYRQVMAASTTDAHG
ncbi:MAG: glycosyltransferase family 4 protein [Acidobacteria bacterium]|nr:glycosyltransferase family 4 protein [Acidobacteriota bacterium]